DPLRVSVQHLPGGGQLDAGRQAIEKGRSQLALKGLDLLGQCRLGDEARPRRPREVAMLDDREEVPQLPELHKLHLSQGSTIRLCANHRPRVAFCVCVVNRGVYRLIPATTHRSREDDMCLKLSSTLVVIGCAGAAIGACTGAASEAMEPTGGITSPAGNAAVEFDLVLTEVRREGDRLVFVERVSGKAGAT